MSWSDRIVKPSVKLSFAKDIWGKGGERESFADIIKRPMAEGGRWAWQPEPRQT
jgi:hypothetical protein